jgi:signal transduction histidine kinase
VLNYVLQYKQALSHNRPRWYRCFLEDGRFVEKRLGTMFCTPVLSSDMVWGTLNLGGTETRRYPKDVVDIVTFVATQVGVALERDNLRKTLEKMNQELNGKTFELRKSIMKMGDANLKLFQMQQQLREKDKRMNVLLEEVQDKNEELSATLTELKQAQTQMVQSEKMASLGQLVAGIAHEINTPAGAIKAASEIIPDYMQKIFQAYDQLLLANISAEHRQTIQKLIEAMVKSTRTHIRNTTAEIRERGRALTERLFEKGIDNGRQLGRDIARCYLEEHFDELLEIFPHYGADVVMDFLNSCNRVLISARDNQLSVETISRIVRALKSYSYLDQSQERRVDLNEDLENTLTILHSQLPPNVTVVRKFDTLPEITCQGSELNQVWTNVIQNALQALEEHGGTTTVETTTDEQRIIVRVIDDGPGIPDDIKDKVFDPFFTTPRGKTKGLGLSIAQQIVRRHHGTITIDSVPGHTCVEIALPKTGIQQSKPKTSTISL